MGRGEPWRGHSHNFTPHPPPTFRVVPMEHGVPYVWFLGENWGQVVCESQLTDSRPHTAAVDESVMYHLSLGITYRTICKVLHPKHRLFHPHSHSSLHGGWSALWMVPW